MRSALEIGGVAVDLVVPAGPIEQIVASRYAGYLGLSDASVCALELDPHGDVPGRHGQAPAFVERMAGARFAVSHPDFRGFFDLWGHGRIRTAVSWESVDATLRTLFALLLPLHDGLLLHDSGGDVMVRRRSDGWITSSTPFQHRPDDLGLPRETTLGQRRLGTGRLEDSVVLPTVDHEIGQAVRDLLTALRTFSDWTAWS